jgi:hypothetical protein
MIRAANRSCNHKAGSFLAQAAAPTHHIWALGHSHTCRAPTNSLDSFDWCLIMTLCTSSSSLTYFRGVQADGLCGPGAGYCEAPGA